MNLIHFHNATRRIEITATPCKTFTVTHATTHSPREHSIIFKSKLMSMCNYFSSCLYNCCVVAKGNCFEKIRFYKFLFQISLYYNKSDSASYVFPAAAAAVVENPHYASGESFLKMGKTIYFLYPLKNLWE